MIIYPLEAITAKTIDKFTYDLYSSVNINKLKYNNDSSAVFRILTVLVDVLQKSVEDLGYQLTMTMNGMEFINIDRMAAFGLSIIPGIDISAHNGMKTINTIIGYSKYTDKAYPLRIVDNKDDFVRHSFPCDMFLSGATSHVVEGIYTFEPNVMVDIKIKVPDSNVTFRILGGLNINSKLIQTIPITLVVRGLDLRGSAIEERIDIIDDIDIVSHLEYSYLESAMLLNSNSMASVHVYPYVTGENVLWQEKFVDREDEDEFFCVVNVDYNKKCLNINAIHDVSHDYPNKYYLMRQVPFKFERDDESIHSYYADPPNRVVYILTTRDIENNNAEKKLYCFPLIIPTKYCNTIDKTKTRYQSISVEYYEDTIAEEYTFYIFPTSRTNDVEVMDINIRRISTKNNWASWVPGFTYKVGEEVSYNGRIYVCITEHMAQSEFNDILWMPNVRVYKSDLLLDLIRENIETNRITIPFEDLFLGDQNECIVEFETSGIDYAILPIYLHKPQISPFYIKKIDDIMISWKNKPDMQTGGLPLLVSSKYDYITYDVGGLGFGEEGFGGVSQTTVIPLRYGGPIIDNISDIFMYKISTLGNVLMNGSRIVNVFDTFYYDETNDQIITSDTITYVSATGTAEDLSEEL